MIEDDFRYTPLPNNAVPHEVPLTVIEPVLVVMLTADARIPKALVVPFPLTPVRVTHPDPPACTLDDVRFTPVLSVFAPPLPSITMLPPVVFTFTVEPLMQTPSNEPFL